ncbi:MAG: hypothetical protein AB7E39_08045 [Endomicrobiaceae bacterium]
MQKIKIADNKILNKNLNGIDRIYIGNDYCENNLNFSNINKLIGFYEGRTEITLLFPFLTDKSFAEIEKTVAKFNKIPSKKKEIVFNDWGLFYFLRKYYPEITLVMGRLLTKQKKDPRAGIILNNKQDKIKIIKSESENKIIRSKTVPKPLLDIFSRHSVESDEFFDFLLKNNVSRIEIDNLKWNMLSSLTKKLKASLYFPYMLLTVTRYCGAMNGKYLKVCNYSCRKKTAVLDKGLYIKGNAVYYKNDIMPGDKILRMNNIDRIVYQEVM